MAAAAGVTATANRTLLLRQLIADGATHVFGNPGTVEQGFLDAMSEQPSLQYVLALQESVALAMADGYARATKRPTFVQLHSGVGLGNAVGMLYQAMRGHAPLVVLAGDAGLRYDAFDAQMAADLVGMARPVTKWAGRAVDAGSVLRLLRRAVKIAGTPPMGPVFLQLPMDVLDASGEEDVLPTTIPSTRVAPDRQTIAECARLLAQAERPLLVVGDGVAASGAEQAVARVATLVGAEVWGADCSEVMLSPSLPNFRGQLGHMFGSQSRALVDNADCILICGTYVFPEVFPALGRVFHPDARLIHVDLNAYEIAKNFPVDVGVVADPQRTLDALADQLERTLTAAQRDAAAQRNDALRRQADSAVAAAREADAAHRDDVPVHVARFMSELAGLLPPDAVVFDEALTSSPDLLRYWTPSGPGSYFQTRGGSLGVGIPGALGLKLAWPERTVVGITGDGGAMYTIQALWSAVHHDIAAKFVVCNNRSYRLLKLNLQHYWQDVGMPAHAFPAMFDLLQPELRFDRLSQAIGVPAVRVEHPDEARPAIVQALQAQGPFLIDLAIDGEVPGDVTHVRCGQ